MSRQLGPITVHEAPRRPGLVVSAAVTLAAGGPTDHDRIASLERQVLQLQADLSDKDTAIDSLQSDFEALTQRLATVEGGMPDACL